MAFIQFKLDIATEQTRGIFNTYVYETDSDTQSEVQAGEYFTDSRFAISDKEDWFGGLILCKCSDGFFQGIISSTGGVQKIEAQSFQSLLRGIDTTDQTPTGLNQTTPIKFGAAQGSSSDPVEMDANGVIKFNQDFPNAIITVVVSFGRAGGVGVSKVFFRTLINGTPVGQPILKEMDDADSQETVFINIHSPFFKDMTIQFEFVRDPSGDDSGSLLTATPTATGWTVPSPSADVTVVALA
jgi:hypothetical protein